jgi:hypothetical protein
VTFPYLIAPAAKKAETGETGPTWNLSSNEEKRPKQASIVRHHSSSAGGIDLEKTAFPSIYFPVPHCGYLLAFHTSERRLLPARHGFHEGSHSAVFEILEGGQTLGFLSTYLMHCSQCNADTAEFSKSARPVGSRNIRCMQNNLASTDELLLMADFALSYGQGVHKRREVLRDLLRHT